MGTTAPQKAPHERVLVTGGAGFIGSTFVRHLVATSDVEVVVLDALTYAGNRENLASVRERIEFVHGDICDAATVADLLRGVDAVVHFAAESHVTRSESDPEVFQRTNVDGTATLLDAAVGSRVGRFVHISTDEVYGDAAGGVSFCEEDKEPGDHQATSAYAKSKARADDLAASYRPHLPVDIVRPTNNFGPFQHPEKAFPRWVTRVLRGEPISLWGEGDQVRDWLFAVDTARAVDLVLRSAPPGGTWNVAAEHHPDIRNRDLAHWLLGRLHDHGARLEHQADLRVHHDARYAVDSSRIRQLGWRPSDDVWRRFDETCRWYQANERWWRPLVADAEGIYA